MYNEVFIIIHLMAIPEGLNEIKKMSPVTFVIGEVGIVKPNDFVKLGAVLKKFILT